MKIKVFYLFIISIVCIHCTKEKKEADADIPVHIQQIENVILFPTDVEPGYQITLSREVVFGDTEDVFLGASITSIITDEKGQVYIANFQQNIIHVYDHEGSYLQQIGRAGQGPGEFQRITAIRLSNDYIHILDSVLSKISIFDKHNFEHQKDINITPSENTENSPSWIEWANDNMFMYRAIDFYIDSEENYLMIFGDPSVGALDNLEGRTWEVSLYDSAEEEYLYHDILSFKADINAYTFDEGRISSVLFKPEAYMDANRERMVYAWGEELLFYIYDTKGVYQHALYYNHPNIDLILDELVEYYKIEFAQFDEFRDSIIRSLRRSSLPQTWPAIQSLAIDNESRIWVSTIVENFDVYEWWVLEETGDLIARFEWSRNKPIEVVKNDFVYTRETDEDTGLQQVVRYRIDMEDR